MLALIELLLFLFAVLFAVFRKDQPAIFGIYCQPGRWYPLKFLAFYLLLRLRQWQAKSGKSGGYGVKLDLSPPQMERVQLLTAEHPKAVDAVFFIAAKDGCYFVLGCERRFGNKAHCSFYLLIPQLGLLTLCQQPETLFTDSKDDAYGAGGIFVQPVEPMKKWKIQYNGKAKLLKSYDPKNHSEGEVMDISLNANWVSNLPYFDYDSNMHPAAAARAFAREKWTREYFRNLRRGHQSHYEQMGDLRGTATVNGTSYDIDLPSFRDHSYSPVRDWKLLHRFAYFSMFLPNGMKAVAAIVCQPSTCSRLELGYVYTPSGELHPLSWCDFHLEQHGEGGTPPQDFAFRFAAGGNVYIVKAKQKEFAYHYMGEEWEARNCPSFCEYTVNDIPGYGLAEWNYRNHQGRSVETSS